ncbi:MAG TPA: FAD-binding protein [Gammaproteobacteria bacterium]|nr:FAD-binding protein [Gammaproteobacteria bacterium]
MLIADKFTHQIRACVGQENVLTEKTDCWVYGYDNSRRQASPDLVVFATETSQVKNIIDLCHQYEIPLITRGRGTGTTGATVPVSGGLILSLERMDKILKIDPANRYLIAQPGVTNQAIQQAAAQHGFFWPPDPTSSEFCTLGGNLAYNSAGPRAVKYGTPRENTLGLRAVIGTGEEIHTGVCTTKGVVGYDLTRLLIGSEGTLAVITEATLKLTPLPEVTHSLKAVYRDIQNAAKAVSAIMAQPVTPSSLEFIDKASINMIREYSDIEMPVADAILMIEIDGNRSGMEDSIQSIKCAATNDGLLSIEDAENEQERQSLWRTRKALSPALRKIAPKKINEDIVVPVSNIPALLEGLEHLSEQHGIAIVNFGHAGNGNIHVNLLIDPDKDDQLQEAEICLGHVFDLVLSLDGTLSGEHGVGLEKRNFIDREIDPVTLGLMKKIKQQFDPKNILNPGKTLPE